MALKGPIESNHAFWYQQRFSKITYMVLNCKTKKNIYKQLQFFNVYMNMNIYIIKNWIRKLFKVIHIHPSRNVTWLDWQKFVRKIFIEEINLGTEEPTESARNARVVNSLSIGGCACWATNAILTMLVCNCRNTDCVPR